MYIALFFIFGLVFGSFYNVVGLRVPEKKSIVRPGSHCTSCQRPLSSIDLIPVLSYKLFKGKCRTCDSKISPIYPMIEVSTGLLFTFSYLQFGWSPELIGSLIIVSLLIIIFISDIFYMLIPDKILLFFAPLVILYRFWIPTEPWWDAWLGSIIGFSLLFLIAVISKGGMGGGDIKLFAVLGLFFGWKGILLILFLASLIGSVIGIILMILKKVERKQHVPFGPFIVLAAFITLFWGDIILDWYFR
ncbi:prepilin peptidase [Pseudalkalibacillus berkeleyi]|uniref:Prepilin leader peptidase/N-methyltransferase n=1 Tax=Pseudalkalibacillus berkeleyi TaxID=1069813 RepID=A0ABS9H2F3_9BACL|nr:A24 family peptidase [Pseudalkalibacillus berkeleyi]MCF6138104.1 prepilin peptidase [Pseudalkalibacillus berkeleyi]